MRSRRDHCNAVLSKLFVKGQPAPTRQQLIDAYPYGTRKHWPYKVWCDAVRAWKAAYAKGAFAPPAIQFRAKSAAERANADASTGSLL